MATITISNDEWEDFLDECVTDPALELVQRQLDTATSLTSFTATAERHGYGGDPRGPETDEHWTERLRRQLDEAPAPRKSDDLGRGWAGRVAGR